MPKKSIIYHSNQAEKAAKAHKLLWENLDYRAYRTAINKQNMQNPETRAKCQNQGSFKKGHIVPDEMKANISQATKAAMARPDIKAKIAAGIRKAD